MGEPLQTVTQVSRQFGVSTRMLRYYEQAGLLNSSRVAGYAYRMYDEEATARLQQLLLLRRLRIPVKQIKSILQNPDATAAMEVFRQNVAQLGTEIQALSSVRYILMRLMEELQKAVGKPLQQLLITDDLVLSAVDAVALANIKEDKPMTMLNNADKTLARLTDVRIITLPPATVAAGHHVGDDPESHARQMVEAFVKKHKLWQRKPDLRSYGFNHPNPTDETGRHGYELWVTIPPEMEVALPLVKKQFAGGLYAAHMITFPNFNEWEDLVAWVNQSEEYEFAGNWADQEHMCGLLDEHLNYVAHVQLENTEPEGFQLDLLMPVRPQNR